MPLNNDISKIYARLTDNMSKNIYVSRLLYNLTGDTKYLADLVRLIPEGKIVHEKLQAHTAQTKIVFGAGMFGRGFVQANPDVDFFAYVDNFIKSTRVDDLPVIDVEDLLGAHRNSYVIITPWRYADIIEKQLLDGGIEQENILNVGTVMKSLLGRQYWDCPYIRPLKQEVFVDAGVMDGETSKAFIHWCDNNYKQIYMIEPDKQYQNIARQNLQQDNNVILYPFALWDKAEKLSFSKHIAEGGSYVDIHGKGDNCIEGRALDTLLFNEKVTYIKMDIEGAEVKALQGARNILATQKPRLAISLYHSWNDLWTIPLTILDANPTYKFYIRHYTLGEWETVLYAF